MRIARTRTKRSTAPAAVVGLTGSLLAMAAATAPAAQAAGCRAGGSFTVTTTGAKLTGTMYDCGTDGNKVTGRVYDTKCDGREARGEFWLRNSEGYKMVKAGNGCDTGATYTCKYGDNMPEDACISRHDRRGYRDTKCDPW
ncbi:hypothetical protein [Streptomyces sp. NPDC015350]|uniref:hypothetical protein n=1 Tax=Streptomyces sp. NPDC015350 TaxID=3364955 RepID=UPI003702149B